MRKPFTATSFLFIGVTALTLLVAQLARSHADTTTPATQHSSSAQVVIENDTFKPATITVDKGQQITFVNRDDDPHTVTAIDGSFDSKGLAGGDSFSYKFTKSGTFNYYCKVHPFMKGTVVVRDVRS